MCKAWNRVCYKCQKLNHFANVGKANIQQIHLVENDTHSQSSDTLCDDTYTLGLYHTSATHTIPPYICNVQIEGSNMVLEIDTGSSVSVIWGVKWAKMCQKSELTLDTHNVPRLLTYAGTTIEPLGRAYVNVCHNDQQHRLPAIIVPGSGPNLLERDWLAVFKVNWATVYQIDKEDFLVPYKSVFSEGTPDGLTAMFYIEDTIESTNSEKDKEVEESTPASTVSLTGLIVRNSYEQRQLVDNVFDEAPKRHIDGIRTPRSCSIIKDLAVCDIDADMHSDVDKAVDQTLAAAIDYSDSTTVADEDEADIITHRVAVATMSTYEVAEQEHDDDGTKQDVMPPPSSVSNQSQPLLESDKQVSSLSQNGRMSSELLTPAGATCMRKKTAPSCDESKANRKMPGAAILRKQFEYVDVNYCIPEFLPGKGLHCEKLLRPIHVPHMWKRKKKRKPEEGDK